MITKFSPFVLASLLVLHQADTTVIWQEPILIDNQPTFADTGGVSHAGGTDLRKHGLYGSEYGRMVRLKNGNWLSAYTISRNNGYRNDPKGGLELQVSESIDNGKTWKNIAILTDSGRDLDNAQLCQLPNGNVLLACRSVRWQESYRLPVYQSTDNGKTWNKRSMIDAAEGTPGSLGKPDKGIYEPHMGFLADGRLSVMYANEKHVTENPSYSQIISQKISTDLGASWGPEIWVAYELGHDASRPGMPVWDRLKDGRYMVVYEICGPEKCNVYYKISADGVQWPVGLGTLIPDQLGGPYLLSMTDGRLVVSSNSSHISVSSDSGKSWQRITDAWPKMLWSSLYEPAPNQIIVMNSVERSGGGHNVQIRFGQLSR
ncbi:sialidase family protein [Spirosoma sp.]|uniref:sialidase family protein n=1 Tax=Spirosoma sp. TaxID=1899569 RepID=UPI003B3A5AE2